MSTKTSYIVIGIVVALFLALMFFVAGQGRKHSWREHYDANKMEPYGTSVLFKLMKNYFEDEEFKMTKDSFPDMLTEEVHSNYVFLGPSFWLDSFHTVQLLDFVKKGNDAMIVTNAMPLRLLDSVSYYECVDLSYWSDSVYYEDLDNFFEDSTATLNFTHRDLSRSYDYYYTFKRNDKATSYYWDYLDTELFCDNQTVFSSLGTIRDTLVNFAKADYGEGHFYFHTTPLAFTNLFLIKEEGIEYAEKVFSHLSPGPIYWDKVHNERYRPPRRRAGFEESPLKYILSQPSLKWAWYVLLGMALMYLLFRAKRRQRIIPVLEKNENTSLEFINTIGRLYFIQNNHRQLALKKMKLFLGFVREHYNMPTKDINESFKTQLATKSEIPRENIDKIFTMHQNIERSGFASENTLVDFHRVMEHFYLHCK